MSEVGATRQFSLQRLARPFTTSALLPMSLSRPMTFLRHVPILFVIFHVRRQERSLMVGRTDLRNMSLCSASFSIKTNSSILSTSYSML